MIDSILDSTKNVIPQMDKRKLRDTCIDLAKTVDKLSGIIDDMAASLKTK
tara:strand:- start:284 stop:433 length:150 start_codon:yes stop_codon:yes gene_type:complete